LQFLYTNFLSTKIHIHTALELSQDIYLDYLGDFKAIVAAAEEGMRCTSNDEKWPGFTFEGGFLPSLYLVGLKCRDPEARGAKNIELDASVKCERLKRAFGAGVNRFVCWHELWRSKRAILHLYTRTKWVAIQDEPRHISTMFPVILTIANLAPCLWMYSIPFCDEASPDPWLNFTQALLVEK